jgi:RimJ/RimL family protein N-acetyltransferase
LSAITLRRGGLDDLPFFMATERRPGYEGKVGRWQEDEHRHALAAPSQAYLIGLDDDRTPVAFAIIRAIGDAHGNTYLKRIAVTQPGQGVGRRFLAAVTGWVFRETAAHRFWLEVLATNARARHVYRTSGFTEEGAAREGYRLADGTRVDLVVMSMLRSEWNEPPIDPLRRP